MYLMSGKMNRISDMITTFVYNYLEGTKSYSPARLIAEFWCFTMLLRMAMWGIALIIYLVVFFTLGEASSEEFLKMTERSDNPLERFYWFETVLIVPVIETLIFQALLLQVLLRNKVSRKKAVIVSSAIFALFHLNPLTVLFAFPIGLMLAWTYLLGMRRSHIWAIAITVILHSLVNASAEVLNVLLF
jgi:membrane protease YdiL (CAAX protease family)